MAEIIDNEKLPWPSRLADFSYNCVKWGLLITAVGIPSGLILSLIIKGFGEIWGGVCFAIGLGSFLIGLISSSIALFGMLLYRFKIYGTGRALGIFVLTFCGFSIGWAIVQPALLNAKRLSEQVLCESHIKGLSSALRMYSYENNGQYPTPEKWSELILKHSGSFNEKTFWCRAESKGTFSYAINEYLYQTEPNKASSDTVLLFEAADLGHNGLGSDHLMLRHKKGGKLGCYISFVDGRVKFITEEDIPNLRWKVEQPKNNYLKEDLFNAIVNGDKDEIQMVLSNGVDVNSRNELGFHVLYIAVAMENFEIIQFLIDKGADINAQSIPSDRTALHSSIGRRKGEFTEFLLKKGANPNIIDNEKGTPLHEAIAVGRTNEVKFLLKFHADTSMKNFEGKTPIDIAREQDRKKILELLD